MVLHNQAPTMTSTFLTLSIIMCSNEHSTFRENSIMCLLVFHLVNAGHIVSEGLILNQHNVGVPKQCYKLTCYLKPVATNYDKTQQEQKQHHFAQIFIPQNTPYSASFFATKIPQNTLSENSAFCKVHLPLVIWPGHFN